MIEFMKKKTESEIAFEKHKEIRIQEMHDRFLNYKLKKKEETKAFSQHIRKSL
jgi:hypothetical protein